MKKYSPIARLLEWRKANPDWNLKRLEGVKKSEKLKLALIASGEKYKAKRLKSRSEHARMKPGENHCSSKLWTIRSPTGLVYKFKGLAEFIRENPHLFLPEDVVWKRGINKRGITCMCRAYSGISSLRSKAKTAGSWKGWTWFSEEERVFNKSEDLLDRKTNETQQPL